MRQRELAHAIALSCGLSALIAPGPAARAQAVAPVGVGDHAYVVTRGGSLDVAAPGVLTDDAGGSLTAVLTRDVRHGALSLTADGAFHYTHDGGSETLDGFTYRTTDGVLEGAEATVALAVVPRPGATHRVPDDFADVQDAIDAAQSGDLILIAPGSYRENLDIDKPVTIASWFLTTGDPSYIATTILDGRGNANVIDVKASAGDGTHLVGLTLQNAEDGITANSPFHLLRSLVRWTKDGIDYEDGSGGSVRYCVFEENDDDGIDPDQAVDVVIEHNIIRNNGGDGIEIRLQPYSGPLLHYVIRHNRIYGNGEDGIQLIDYDELTDRRFEIAYNAIHDNAQAGIGMMSGANTQENYEGASIQERIVIVGNTFARNNHGLTGGDNTVVVNNLFVGHPVLGVKNVDGSSELAFNLFHDNGSHAENANLDPATTFTDDPLLDPELRLLVGSPAIDAGTARYVFQGETALDLDDSAYEGAAPDLGAVEWLPGTGEGPEAPALVAPADAASDLPLTPTLRWQGPGDTHQLQIATGAGFLSSETVYNVAVHGAAQGHTVAIGVLDHVERYFWRVRGSQLGATGSWSEVRSFTTQAPSGPPGAPILTTPLPGVSDVDLEPTLVWRGAADLFTVQLAPDPSFAVRVFETSTAAKRVGVDPGALAHATTYHWRVRGENVFGPGPWSAVFSFTTRPPPPPLQPPWGLFSPVQTETSIDLRWQEPADPRVVAYAIERDGVRIGSESEPDHLAVGLVADTLYHFRVTSIAAGGEESQPSGALGVWTARRPGSAELSFQLDRSTDDAEERLANGNVTTDDSALELVEAGPHEQIVGLRFRSVDVPGDASILGARIQFTAGASDGSATSLLIEAEASDDASSFQRSRGDLSSRATGDAAVSWDPPAWSNGASGADERTPELTALVQEIVDRPGWESGNAMAFLITGSGQRAAGSYDGDPDTAPVLEIERLDFCDRDADGDGFVCEVDCDDADDGVHPDAVERCDGRDTDCDNSIDEGDAADAPTWYLDFDGDGFGDATASTSACAQPSGWVDDASDCNDADGTAFPGARDGCNGRDDDCDGEVDEDFVSEPVSCGVGACQATGVTACENGVVIDSCKAGKPEDGDATCDAVDDDCDGSVDEDYGSQSCATGQPGICAAGTTRCQEGIELCAPSQGPLPEVCDDGLDNDCDGATDGADTASCTAETFTLSVAVSAGEDDAEERVSEGGAVSRASSSLQLVEDGSRQQAVGVRFRDVGLPPGASIVSAHIQFSSDDTDSGSTTLSVGVQASDDAAAFERVDGDVTSRPRTGRSVAWTPDPWTGSQETGADQRTPDLAALVQDVVDRPGWASGNALVFVITGSGTRTARSYDGTPDRAPVLVVEYAVGGGGCTGDADGDGFACELDCDDADPGVHPGASDLCDGVDNDCDGELDENFASQSCATGEPGICAAGTTSCDGGAELCLQDLQPEPEVCHDGVDNDCDGDVDLADAGSCTPQAVSVAIAAGSDDAEERISSGGSVSLASSSLELVEDGDRHQAVGLRFAGLEVPRGATIVGARVQFNADEVDTASADLLIEGEASDDAVTFARVDGDVTSRPRTGAAVAWLPDGWTSSQAAGADQRTPELTTIVQEIVDRPGWSSSNALVLVITGSGTRTARSYDGTPSRAAVLEVEFLAAP